MLRNSKCWDIYSSVDYTRNPDHAENATLYWKEKAHVIMSALPAEVEPEPSPEPPKEGKLLTVLGNNWNIREEPNSKSKSLGKAHKGDIYSYVGKQGHWYGILFNGRNAYIYDECAVRIEEPKPVEPLPDTINTYIKVVGGTLCIRSGAGTVYKKIGYTNETELYPVLDVTSNNWYKIIYNGKEAYVSGNTKYTELVNGN